MTEADTSAHLKIYIFTVNATEPISSSSVEIANIGSKEFQKTNFGSLTSCSCMSSNQFGQMAA
ncbi:hypothetical protein SAMN06297164_3351 [Nitrosomonas ureae]|uniref:Uncharacterized protein n=1 Tax=Nitrosomonas ureae TaxID=44577 RepID=A0A286AJN9_9PROT|nr:hypothetical protein SAMN06297164_3351 [Nitrosomonas ureae]